MRSPIGVTVKFSRFVDGRWTAAMLSFLKLYVKQLDLYDTQV